MGHPSAFWPQLARGFREAGHRVLKIDFCLADRIFWRGTSSQTYRGALRDWPGWLARYLRAERVTDVLYCADRHPYHVAARSVAERLGVRTWAIEFGYLRPDWLTLEPGGMGAFSHFPRDLPAISALAQGLASPDQRPLYPHGFLHEAASEVGFHLVQALGRPLYPRFVSDKAISPLLDYLSWLPQLVLGARRQGQAHVLEERARAGEVDYNIVAMQIEADYQIRGSSPYRDLTEFVTEVMASFRRRAPQGRKLVFKLHPLDNGLGRWFRRIPALARRHGIESRVEVIRGGDLDGLLMSSRGVVLVNSTVALHAMRRNVPVCALGSAIYKVPGLVHRSGLDRFWTEPEPVNPETWDLFLRALTRVQVKGSFYHPVGRRVAIREIVSRVGSDVTPIGARHVSPTSAKPKWAA